MNEFAEENSLKVDPSKTEVIAFARNSDDFTNDHLNINGVEIALSSRGCCLGYWWHRSLLSSEAVEENISKARKAFFASGCLGAFQGQLNPLSSRSIYLTCILPILLYGCKNWILNDSLLDRLDRFQAWVGKRILGLTKFHNNTIVPITLDLLSTHLVILVKKL